MLTLKVVAEDSYDESSQKFVDLEQYTLVLEHSLVSLSKWESKYEKPFLGPQAKTNEETLWYIDAMRISPADPPDYSKLLPEHFAAINEYVNAKQSATWFTEKQNAKRSRETITAELIYYWMISLNIPLDWENRHLNRLLTLIRVCNEKNQPPKKMGPREVRERQRQINEQRRAQLGTRG